MRGGLRFVPAAVAFAAVAVLASFDTATARAPSAPAAREPATVLVRCNISGRERRLGPTYVTALSAERVSCRAAESLVRAYYRCRVASGGRDGRCRRRVQGYRCSERRGAAIATQFDARVTCRRGAARVVHSYTQFT